MKYNNPLFSRLIVTFMILFFMYISFFLFLLVSISLMINYIGSDSDPALLILGVSFLLMDLIILLPAILLSRNYLNNNWIKDVEQTKSGLIFVYRNKRRRRRIFFSEIYDRKDVNIGNFDMVEYSFVRPIRLLSSHKRGQFRSYFFDKRIEKNFDKQFKYNELDCSKIPNNEYAKVQRIMKLIRLINIIVFILAIVGLIISSNYEIFAPLLVIFLLVFLKLIQETFKRFYINKIPIEIHLLDEILIIDCRWDRYFYKISSISSVVIGNESIYIENSDGRIRYYFCNKKIKKMLRRRGIKVIQEG